MNPVPTMLDSHAIALGYWVYDKPTARHLLIGGTGRVHAWVTALGQTPETLARSMDETHAKALRLALAREAEGK